MAVAFDYHPSLWHVTSRVLNSNSHIVDVRSLHHRHRRSISTNVKSQLMPAEPAGLRLSLQYARICVLNLGLLGSDVLVDKDLDRNN